MTGRILTLLCMILLFTSCKKSKRNLEEDIKLDFSQKLNPSAQNIAVISKNDVYYFSDLKYSPARVTNTPNEVKTNIKVSYDGSKVAFLNATGYVEIWKTSGELVEELTNYYNPTCFNWSANGETLYLLVGNTINFYGPSLKIPDLTNDGVKLSNIFNGYVEVSAVAISPRLDILYSYTIRTSSGYYGYTYEANTVFKEAGSTEEVILSTNSSSYSDVTSASDLNFANATNDMLISISNPSYDSNYSNSLVSELNVYYYKSKSLRTRITNSYNMVNPVFRSDLSLYVSGTRGYSSDNFVLTLNRAYNSQTPAKTLSDYSGTDETFYCDWK